MTSKKVIVLGAVAGILFSLVGGLVAYAAVSSQLPINGSAEFQPESWEVKFKASSLSTPTLANGGLTGSATIATAPTLSDTSISNFKILLKMPGDSGKYTFYVENTGALDAVLSTYVSTSPVCTGSGATKVVDETLVCGADLSYTFKYIGGDLSTNNLTNGQEVAQNDILKAGTEVQLELKLEYSNAATNNPVGPVTIDGLNKTLIYTVSN